MVKALMGAVLIRPEGVFAADITGLTWRTAALRKGE